MDYAMKSLSVLSLGSLSKCVSAGATMTKQLLSDLATRPKPFRFTCADRSLKKGVMATGLQDLIDKITDSLQMSCVDALVLDEDGTGVETEEFFHTLPDNTVFMALEKGQKWTPCPNALDRVHLSANRAQHRRDVAKVTFDLYKNNPKDFIGCLSMKATLYGTYSVSYDLRCYTAKRFLRETLRWTLLSMQMTGHVLIGSSCYIEQLLEEEDARSGERPLALPQDSRVRELQSTRLGRLTQ